jgi:GntR family transcriptional repressor for pyruvate dehydrogenase complex
VQNNATNIGLAHGMVFQPIVHKRTAEAVVERFRSLILDGVLRPGDRLPAERQLAQDLDVSRPILRDALSQLEAEGLIVARHGEGTFIADLIGDVFSAPIAKLLRASPLGMADYLEFRRLVEADMAAMAADRATQSDRDMLQALGKAMCDAHANGDAKREAKLDVELHTLIVESAHNLVFLHVLRACYTLLADDVFDNRQRLYEQPGERKTLLDQHLALIEAVISGEAQSARRAAQAHIDHVSQASQHLSAADAREETSKLRRTIRLANAG